jgi:hypothetical protein
MNRLGLIIVCIVCLNPMKAMAIEISEVVWMGSAASANHEWIELYSPETIDVTGWTITDGNNLQIELDGTISSGEYAVLERTSDASAPGTAWQIYTGALVNTGATLTLLDATGAVVDRVTGGEDWELIGGDNVTKATAQLSTSGWITSAATPGQAATGIAQAAASDEDQNETEDPEPAVQKTTSRKSSSAESIQLTLPDITLQLAIAAPQTTYVNQPVTFAVSPSGVGSTIAQSLHYTWSFGDTDTASGKEAQHAYPHPGNYVVVVEAEYKRQIQRTRHEIVVLPVSLTLTELEGGDFAIQNNSQTEIDLAGYRLIGNKTFTIPDYTILLPRSQIVIKRDKFLTAPTSRMVALYDHAKGQTAIHLPKQLAARATPPPTERPATSPTPRISAIDDSSRYTFATRANAAEPEGEADEPPPVTSTPQNSQVAAAGATTLPTNWPQYALVVILLLGIVAVYLIPKKEKIASPWD